MKKLLVVLLVLISSIGYSQSNTPIDSMEFIYIKKNVSVIILRMDECHKQYKIGTGLLVTGMAISCLGVSYMSDNIKLRRTMSMSIIGCLISMVGVGIQIDSHKFLNIGAWRIDKMYKK